ncbi:hypothetical protein H4S07_002242 [Coemansia furcata]|uniref:Uncharacterized protein n=1 Tax=Coemansia furcata TaxID=417177 RepID=A0ACC1LL63_9FUNG|nr:hypothetical protein H4S07_002242 [Coemansia furcata]
MSIAGSNDLEDLDSVIEFSDAEEADESPDDDIEQPLPVSPLPALVEPTELEDGKGENNIANSLPPHDDQERIPDTNTWTTNKSEAEVEASTHEDEPDMRLSNAEPSAKSSAPEIDEAPVDSEPEECTTDAQQIARNEWAWSREIEMGERSDDSIDSSFVPPSNDDDSSSDDGYMADTADDMSNVQSLLSDTTEMSDAEGQVDMAEPKEWRDHVEDIATNMDEDDMIPHALPPRLAIEEHQPEPILEFPGSPRRIDMGPDAGIVDEYQPYPLIEETQLQIEGVHIAGLLEYHLDEPQAPLQIEGVHIAGLLEYHEEAPQELAKQEPAPAAIPQDNDGADTPAPELENGRPGTSVL